jgi:hypothetical protein
MSPRGDRGCVSDQAREGLGRIIVCWRRAQVAGRRHRVGIRRVGKAPAGEWNATWQGSC